jgi:hypothetical protein
MCLINGNALINCNGGCPECHPEEHTFTTCDCCGIHVAVIDTEETNSFGYSGKMCKLGMGCNQKTVIEC